MCYEMICYLLHYIMSNCITHEIALYKYGVNAFGKCACSKFMHTYEIDCIGLVIYLDIHLNEGIVTL